MSAPIIATLDGMTFTTDNSSPNTLATMRGWYSGVPKRIETDVYPNADGAAGVMRDYRSSRVITMTGFLASVDADAAIVGGWAQFAGLQSDGRPSLFTVSDGYGVKSCMVAVASNDVEPIVEGLAEYVLQLVARDPVKYGPGRSLTTGLPSSGGGLEYPLHDPAGALFYGAVCDLGRVTLTNSGTAAVWPTLVVEGGLGDGFFVQRLDTGQVVRYDRVVPAGSTVTIDFRTSEVLIDGVSDGSTYLTRYEFFSIGPGQSVEVQFNAIGGVTGSPVARFTIADGFW
jgi:hypothetical protein